MDAFLASARKRLAELRVRRDAGTLAAADYEVQRRAIEREMSEHLLADVDSAAVRPSARLWAGVAVFVLAVAAAGYWKTGSPSLAGAGPDRSSTLSAAAGGASAASGLQQIAAMVDKLAARMKERPDDAQGWLMLARSYSVLGRFAEAIPAYKRATELQPDNAVLLADYADAVAASRGGVDNPESEQLVKRALAADPKQPKALALAGTIAFDRGDYKGAIDRWQQMAEVLPADSAMLKQVQASIAEARQRAGAPAAAAAPGSAPLARVNDNAAATTPSADAAPHLASGKSVSGTVTLAPGLAAQAAPGDTVFVFARAAGGGRMPLAVQRARVSDLPLHYKLDDAMAMSPAATLSSAATVVVGARISKSGNAMPQAGDLAGEASPVAPGANDVDIRIDSVLGAR
ncbi:MAG TPA: c-type cytochrome biogenesis protein CcmI [Caldimonas sp.]|nr:c-type cytochrome biogenesis protein CcmI [Caldimonas sp.]